MCLYIPQRRDYHISNLILVHFALYEEMLCFVLLYVSLSHANLAQYLAHGRAVINISCTILEKPKASTLMLFSANIMNTLLIKLV